MTLRTQLEIDYRFDVDSMSTIEKPSKSGTKSDGFDLDSSNRRLSKISFLTEKTSKARSPDLGYITRKGIQLLISTVRGELIEALFFRSRSRAHSYVISSRATSCCYVIPGHDIPLVGFPRSHSFCISFSGAHRVSETIDFSS